MKFPVVMNWWILAWTLLGLICPGLSEVPSCPPSKDVYPCYCNSDYLLTSIDCEGIGNINTIQHVLQNTKGLNMSYAFWKSKLNDIPSDFFNGQQSVNLHFENCQISSFGDRPFTGLENTLRKIYIYGSIDKRRKDLDTFPLGHLKKLEELSFQANDIKRLGNEWFKGGPSTLKTLMLEANDIEVIEDQAFSSLINVEQIWMGDNSFKKVYRSMFPRPANKLHLIEMSFSGIEELPEDIFEDMPVLTSINVAGNKLKTLPEVTWGKIWDQLDEAYLERNNGFQCDGNIKWIYQRKPKNVLTGKCADDKHSGKSISELTVADFD